MGEGAASLKDRRPDPGGRLFSFAVLTDTHLNQGEDDCNSPFAVNALANRRLRHVINDLNRRDLAFVVNVGDLLHPVPAVPHLYDEAAARYLEQSAALRHRQYLTPGNHDVGDKPNDWAPTAGVCDTYLACWEKHFGPHYQAFDRGDCHFVIINAQLLNSGLTAEAEQRAWLEADLAASRGRRLFLFTHYPPFIGGAERARALRQYRRAGAQLADRPGARARRRGAVRRPCPQFLVQPDRRDRLLPAAVHCLRPAGLQRDVPRTAGAGRRSRAQRPAETGLFHRPCA